MILGDMTEDYLSDFREDNAAYDRERFARMMALRRWRGEYILNYGFPGAEERSQRMREIGALSPKRGRPRTVAHRAEDPKCRCVDCRQERRESPYDVLRRRSLIYRRF